MGQVIEPAPQALMKSPAELSQEQITSSSSKEAAFLKNEIGQRRSWGPLGSQRTWGGGRL